MACWETDLLDATIHCPGCGAEFAVEQGVARMLPEELRVHVGGEEGESASPPAQTEVADKVSELRARDREVDDYDRMTGLALLTRLEWPRVRKALCLSMADRVLEVGCGTGRITQRLCHESRSLVAADFSFNSLVRCRGKMPAGSAAHLVQADATHLPLRDAVADKVLSCQVVEHLPSEDARRAMMGEIRRATAAGALVVGTAYWYSWLTGLAGGKEGYHKSGIYFFRFRPDELADLWSVAVESPEVAKLTPYLLMARGRSRPRGSEVEVAARRSAARRS